MEEHPATLGRWESKHTFSSSVICPTSALAFSYAAAQFPTPVAFGEG